MSTWFRSGVLAVALGASAVLIGCKREGDSGKPVKLESDLVTKESLEVPETPAPADPKEEEPSSSESGKNNDTAGTSGDRPAAPLRTAPETSVQPKPAASPGISLAEVTPVRAERALRDALRVAVGNVASKYGAEGGIFGDPTARIPLPAEWRSMETAIRKVNRGESVDACLAALNGVAERAAAGLKPELESLIDQADLGNGKEALTSSADGATQAFMADAEDQVKAAAQKTVRKLISDSSIQSARDAMVADARFANPFTNIKNRDGFDLAAYLADELTERLLVGMAGEERALREDPSKLDSESSAAVFKATR